MRTIYQLTLSIFKLKFCDSYLESYSSRIKAELEKDNSIKNGLCVSIEYFWMLVSVNIDSNNNICYIIMYECVKDWNLDNCRDNSISGYISAEI